MGNTLRQKTKLEQQLASAKQAGDVQQVATIAARIGFNSGRLIERERRQPRPRWEGYNAAQLWKRFADEDLLDALADVTASLEAVMAHYGHKMQDADQRGCQRVIERAHGILANAEEA